MDNLTVLRSYTLSEGDAACFLSRHFKGIEHFFEESLEEAALDHFSLDGSYIWLHAVGENNAPFFFPLLGAEKITVYREGGECVEELPVILAGIIVTCNALMIAIEKRYKNNNDEDDDVTKKFSEVYVEIVSFGRSLASELNYYREYTEMID